MIMGKVVHFEIPADNLQRAKKFYSTVFGWTMNDYPEME
jgi:predicted enzyme related to lactoylglutathione lyase